MFYCAKRRVGNLPHASFWLTITGDLSNGTALGALSAAGVLDF